MTIKEFMQTHKVEYTENRINEKDIPLMEVAMGVTMGKELRQYVLDYGYLSFRFAELYGINSRQGPVSDMVKRTVSLHENFPKTRSLIALEDQGDGDLYLVDSNDTVYRFLPASDELTCQNIPMSAYIVRRFSELAK